MLSLFAASLHKTLGAIAAVAGLLLFAQVAQGASSETESKNKALIEQSFEAWRAGTGGPFDLLADDASWTIVGNSAAAKIYGSREDFMREVIRPFNARMQKGLSPTVRGLYADGDTVIALFDGHAVARDGAPYDNTYAWFLEMRDGKIVRAVAIFDSIAFNDLWSRVSP